jgi:hypothetical protein
LTNLQVNDYTPLVGGEITVTTTVQNIGEADSESTKIKYYLSTINTGREYYLGESMVEGLGAYSGQILNRKVMIPRGITGESYIVAVINQEGYLGEESLLNNMVSTQIEVGEPDNEAPRIHYVNLHLGEGPEENRFRTGYEYVIWYTLDDNVAVESIDLYYSTDGGNNWSPIKISIPINTDEVNTGIRWTIPMETPLTTLGRIRIVARDLKDNQATAMSDSFTIIDGTPPQITVISPNGGEVWDLNSQHGITWSTSSSTTIQYATITLCFEDNREPLSGKIDNSGSYPWTLPSTSRYVSKTAKIKVRVEDENGNIGEDYSDKYFQIRDPSQPPPPPWRYPELIPDIHSKPRVAIDETGRFHLVYLTLERESQDKGEIITQKVLYRTMDASILSEPELVYGDTQQVDQDYPHQGIRDIDLALDGQDNPHLVWRKGPGGTLPLTNYNQDEVFYTYRDGSIWINPLNLSSNSKFSQQPGITLDSSGDVGVFWLDGHQWDGDGNLMGAQNIHYKIKGGDTGIWSDTSRINDDVVTSLDVTRDRINNIHVVYSRQRQSGDWQELCHIENDGGGWTKPLALNGTGQHTSLNVASYLGDLHLSWRYYQDLDGGDFRQMICHTIFNGSQWEPIEVVRETLEPIDNPSMVVDSQGTPHLAWQNTGPDTHGIMYSRETPMGWSTRTQLNLDSQVPDQDSLSLTISDDDHLYAFWKNYYDGGMEVFYNRASVTQDTTPPQVILSQPSMGETLSTGSHYNITWSSLDDTQTSNVTLEYSVNEGLDYHDIVGDALDNGCHTWIVPSITSDKVQIRITVRDSAGNTGYDLSESFQIMDETPPNVTLNSPVGGESWDTSSQHTIRWDAVDDIGVSSMDILYSINNGSNWVTLAKNLTDSGEYAWDLPNKTSNKYRVRIVASDGENNQGMATSDCFTVELVNAPPSIPGSPNPMDGSPDIPINASMSWVGGDPEMDSVTYDIYVGVSREPPLMVSNFESPLYQPPFFEHGTLYFWKVVATDEHGSSCSSPIWSFITESEPPPKAPTDLDAQILSDEKIINLEWNDNSGDEDGFRLERRVLPDGRYIPLTLTSMDETSFNDTALGEEITYSYRVQAYSINGDSSYSEETTALLPNTQETHTLSEFTTLFAINSIKMIYPSDAQNKPLNCNPAMVSDWTASAFVYTKLENPIEGLDTDPNHIDQITGKPMGETGEGIITFGGPIVNPMVKYLESTSTPTGDQAPIRYYLDGETYRFQHRNGTDIPNASLHKSIINTNQDIFIIEVFEDAEGRYIMLSYGFGWKGTYAAGKYFDTEIHPDLESYPYSWIIIKWEDTNKNNFVNTPQEGDTYTIIAQG